MTSLPDRLRADAGELQQAATDMLQTITALPDEVALDPSDLTTSLAATLDSQQMHAMKSLHNAAIGIIGMVRAATKADLADAIEYQQAKTSVMRLDEKRKAIVERSAKMRDMIATAIETGDWSQYDEQFGAERDPEQ